MIKQATIIALLLAGIVAAAAQAVYPMIPYTIFPHPELPGGLSGPMVTNTSGGIAPPSCSNSLDFTQSCNSQYIGIGIF